MSIHYSAPPEGATVIPFRRPGRPLQAPPLKETLSERARRLLERPSAATDPEPPEAA